MKVLVSVCSFAECDDTPLRLLRSNGFRVILNPFKRKLKQEEIVKLARDCVGIIAGTEPLTKEVLERLPKLKAISRCGAGMDNIDLEVARERGIAVQGTPDAPTQAVAELTIALILNLLRQISFMDKKVHEGAWIKKMGQLLSGKTVGIIGLGRIGRRVAELLKPFGVTILASELKPDREWAGKHGIHLTSLEELLKKSDVVTLHIPYTKQNRNLINAEKLKTMRKGAILINTSRGGLINEEALYRFLKNGWLAGAALDTMEQEPYLGPLSELENVTLTPHIGSYALEARVRMETEAAKNLVKMLKEEKG